MEPLESIALAREVLLLAAYYGQPLPCEYATQIAEEFSECNFDEILHCLDVFYLTSGPQGCNADCSIIPVMKAFLEQEMNRVEGPYAYALIEIPSEEGRPRRAMMQWDGCGVAGSGNIVELDEDIINELANKKNSENNSEAGRGTNREEDRAEDW